MIDIHAIAQAAAKHDSFYIYDEAGIRENVRRLKANFPSAKFLYSLKCNPHEKVLDTIFSEGFGADAASLSEVEKSAIRGLDPEMVCFSAPGRTEKDIYSSQGKCVFVADSFTAIARAKKIADESGKRARIGLRINPAFSFDGGEGLPNKFGIDEELIYQAHESGALEGIDICGIHVHLKSQVLDTHSIELYHEKLFALVKKFQDKLGITLEFANFGSGIGIPYSDSDAPVDIEKLGQSFESAFSKWRGELPNLKIFIETGRYLTGKNGVFVTKVLDKKVSRGKTFVILKNTLNGFQRLAVAQNMRNLQGAALKSAPDFKADAFEPLFTKTDITKFTLYPSSFGKPVTPNAASDRETEIVTLCGDLCTANDAIASDIELPKIEVGDYIAMTNAGSYAAVISPMQFSGQVPPAELFLEESGTIAEL